MEFKKGNSPSESYELVAKGQKPSPQYFEDPRAPGEQAYSEPPAELSRDEAPEGEPSEAEPPQS